MNLNELYQYIERHVGTNCDRQLGGQDFEKVRRALDEAENDYEMAGYKALCRRGILARWS